MLSGTVAVITGAANKGIGWGLAKKCAEMGMHVAIADLFPAVVDAAASEFGALYPNVTCVGIACDVTKEDSVAAMVSVVTTQFDGAPIGAIFANAGVVFSKRFDRQTLAEFKMTMDVNVIGVVATLQAFL